MTEKEYKNGNGQIPTEKGVVIAELTNKIVRKDKNKDTFWILEISIGKRLTEMYFELRDKEQPTLTTNEHPLYVFSNRNKNRFAYTLTIGYVYLFKYEKYHRDEKDYLHIEDWRKLSDNKRALMRSFQALLDKKDEGGEEEELTNQELLQELKKRIGLKKILFNLSALDSESNDALQNYKTRFDAELRDNEGSFILDLKEKDEEI